MSSKQEIRNAFTAELMNTPEYQIILNIKQTILNEISAPHIEESVVYNFETPLTIEQMNNIKLCMILEFGFYTDNISSNCVFIDMKNFLE